MSITYNFSTIYLSVSGRQQQDYFYNMAIDVAYTRTKGDRVFNSVYRGSISNEFGSLPLAFGEKISKKNVAVTISNKKHTGNFLDRGFDWPAEFLATMLEVSHRNERSIAKVEGMQSRFKEIREQIIKGVEGPEELQSALDEQQVVITRLAALTVKNIKRSF